MSTDEYLATFRGSEVPSSSGWRSLREVFDIAAEVNIMFVIGEGVRGPCDLGLGTALK